MAVNKLWGIFQVPEDPDNRMPGILSIDSAGPIDLLLIDDTTHTTQSAGGVSLRVDSSDLQRIVGHSFYDITSDSPKMAFITLDGCQNNGDFNNILTSPAQGDISGNCLSYIPEIACIGIKQSDSKEITLPRADFVFEDTGRWFYKSATRRGWSGIPSLDEFRAREGFHISINQQEINRTHISLVFPQQKTLREIRRIIKDVQNLLSISNSRFFPAENIIPFKDRWNPVGEIYYYQEPIKDFIQPRNLKLDGHEGRWLDPVFLFNEIERETGMIKWLEEMAAARIRDKHSDIMLDSLLEAHLWTRKTSVPACDQVITYLLSLSKRGKSATIRQHIESVTNSIKVALPQCIDGVWAEALANIRNKFTSHPQELKGFTPPIRELFIAREQAYKVCISHICYNLLGVDPQKIKDYLWEEFWSKPSRTERESKEMVAWSRNYSNYYPHMQ